MPPTAAPAHPPLAPGAPVNYDPTPNVAPPPTGPQYSIPNAVPLTPQGAKPPVIYHAPNTDIDAKLDSIVKKLTEMEKAIDELKKK